MKPEEDNIDYKETLNVTEAHSSTSREKGVGEPRHEPFPLFAFVVCAAVLIAAGSFLPIRDGFAMSSILRSNYVPEGPGGKAGASAAEELPLDQAWVKAGEKIYKGKGACIGCHQASGMGAPGQFPPLVDSEWVINGDERLAKIMLHGVTGQLVVKGAPYNGLMPAQAAQLNDKEIAQVMSYIRTSWGNEASLITEEKIATAREKYKDQTGSYSQSDLEKVAIDADLEGATWDEFMAAEGGGETPPPPAEG